MIPEKCARLLMAAFVVQVSACGGGGGSSNDSASPRVELSASPPGVNLGGRSTLNWSSANVTSCTASGGWSGVQSTSGQQSIGPLQSDTTYALNCTGATGNALGMTTVSVRVARLEWQPPMANTDGSPLTDLAGYRVYYGPSPGNYSHTLDLADPQATQTIISIEPGSWSFAVSALNVFGNESSKSNVANRTVN